MQHLVKNNQILIKEHKDLSVKLLEDKKKSFLERIFDKFNIQHLKIPNYL